jgi:hypothetical protein
MSTTLLRVNRVSGLDTDGCRGVHWPCWQTQDTVQSERQDSSPGLSVDAKVARNHVGCAAPPIRPGRPITSQQRTLGVNE